MWFTATRHKACANLRQAYSLRLFLHQLDTNGTRHVEAISRNELHILDGYADYPKANQLAWNRTFAALQSTKCPCAFTGVFSRSEPADRRTRNSIIPRCLRWGGSPCRRGEVKIWPGRNSPPTWTYYSWVVDFSDRAVRDGWMSVSDGTKQTCFPMVGLTNRN